MLRDLRRCFAVSDRDGPLLLGGNCTLTARGSFSYFFVAAR
jgi:hypothetical protein